jgi:hypothetical protein
VYKCNIIHFSVYLKAEDCIVYFTPLTDCAFWLVQSQNLIVKLDPRQGLKFFLLATASRPTLGPNQLLIQCVPGAVSLGVRRAGREADSSIPSDSEFKKAWNCIPQYVFMTWYSVKHKDNFTFTLTVYSYKFDRTRRMRY